MGLFSEMTFDPASLAPPRNQIKQFHSAVKHQKNFSWLKTQFFFREISNKLWPMD